MTGLAFSNPNPNGKILFNRGINPGNSLSDILLMNPDGSNQCRLPFSVAPSGMTGGEWSPDGSQIVFQRYYFSEADIYSVNADGSNPTRLAMNSDYERPPSWSPDGTKIIFVSRRSGSQQDQIYTMHPDGSNQMRLTANDLGTCPFPKYSPDGSRILFQSNYAGTRDIFVMNADGSGLTILTNNPAADEYPRWSPDSARIVFTGARDFGVQNVWRMNADGSERHRRRARNDGDGRRYQKRVRYFD